MINAFNFTNFGEMVGIEDQLKSFSVNLTNGIEIEINGKKLSNLLLSDNNGLILTFNKGVWNLMITKSSFYSSKKSE